VRLEVLTALAVKSTTFRSWYSSISLEFIHFLYSLSGVIMQDVPGVNVIILGGHSIGHSKEKCLYEHVSYSERFPIFGAQYFKFGAQYYPSLPP
jgi:hypothetical protein